jgi:hypothetical protein
MFFHLKPWLSWKKKGFHSYDCQRIQTKIPFDKILSLSFDLRVLKVDNNVLDIMVMTFLVRECYGSPEKHENSLKFIKIRDEECFDKVLNEEF